MKTKRCKHCDRDLPATIEYFFYSRVARDGLKTPCKECIRARRQKFRQDVPPFDDRPHLDPTQIPAARAMYDNGFSMQRITKELGVTLPAVANSLAAERERRRSIAA